MSHADRIRDQERRVVEAAKTMHTTEAGRGDVWLGAYRETLREVRALLSLEAQTCPECFGAGGLGVYFDEYGIAQPPDEPCPAGCDKGRRREGK